MDSKQLALACRALADNKKAENLVVLDVRKLSTVTDFFVIATGTSEPHLRAIENEVLDGLRREHDLKPVHTEGSAQSHWVVADFFDVIVHIMSADVRAHYDIEGLWADAPRVKPTAPRKRSETVGNIGTTENAPEALKAPKAPKAPKAVKPAKSAKPAKSPKTPKAAPAE
jgi:ribosome-associated protein